MNLALIVIVHAIVSMTVATAVARSNSWPVSLTGSLGSVCLASAAFCAVGFFVTSRYLVRRNRLASGVVVGAACGALCGAFTVLIGTRMDFSLILFLSIFAPMLLAVLLASFVDRPKSGWQTGRVA